MDALHPHDDPPRFDRRTCRTEDLNFFTQVHIQIHCGSFEKDKPIIFQRQTMRPLHVETDPKRLQNTTIRDIASLLLYLILWFPNLYFRRICGRFSILRWRNWKGNISL